MFIKEKNHLKILTTPRLHSQMSESSPESYYIFVKEKKFLYKKWKLLRKIIVKNQYIYFFILLPVSSYGLICYLIKTRVFHKFAELSIIHPSKDY